MEGLNSGNGRPWQPHAHADHELTAISAAGLPIGEIIDTAVAEFSAQACELNVAPPFGGFVKVTTPDRTVYGVVYAIHTGSIDPGGRPVLRGREGMRDRAIFEQNPDLEQLLRTEFSALIIGYDDGAALRTYLPPSPPPLHWSVVECDQPETARLTARLDYLRTIIATSFGPIDALLAANIRLAADAHPNNRRFRVEAGRELATLLKHDYPRLSSILRALAD